MLWLSRIMSKFPVFITLVGVLAVIVTGDVKESDKKSENVLKNLTNAKFMNKINNVVDYGELVEIFGDPNDAVGGGKVALNRTGRTLMDFYANEVLVKYHKNGRLIYVGSLTSRETVAETGCSAHDHFAFLMHGWMESCNVEWMQMLIQKLYKYRGGCIVCFDYEIVSFEPYLRLFRLFDDLTNGITAKLKSLKDDGVMPQKSYFFGFSYGGQLALHTARRFGKGQAEEVDTCDMAGVGFDLRFPLMNHKTAAQNVQCIHTTRDKGTRFYNCHQNWRMGNCGISQPSASDPPKGSHGMCPYIYVSAFEHDFYAIDQPNKCVSRRPAASWPTDFKMGYMETRKQEVEGELFSPTAVDYPYNVRLIHVNLGPDLESQFSPQNRKKISRPIWNTIKKASKFWFRRRQDSRYVLR